MEVHHIGLLGSWKSRLPSLDASYSSLDTVTWNLARALRRRGLAVTVGCATAAAECVDGIELVRVHEGVDDMLRAPGRHLGLSRALRARWSARRHHPCYLLEGVLALRRRGVQAITVTHEFANLLPARVLAGRVPLVTHLHAVWADDHPHLARRLLAADGVAAVSDFVREALCEVEPRLARRTATVRNGVDLTAFPGRAALRAADPAGVAAWRERLGARGRPLIVAVGRVAPEKGHHVLAAASALLAARGIDAVVAVAGQLGGTYERPGRARQRLWRTIEALTQGYADRTQAAAGAADFHLLGTVEPEDVRRLLAAADVFVAPSLSPEPCPLPVLEALAMDLPVVSSASGGYPELVGHAALLVPPGDPVALADALDLVLTDQSTRARLAAGARAQAGRHTWDATAAALATMVAGLA